MSSNWGRALHPPCKTCRKFDGVRCGETNATVPPDAGRSCSLYQVVAGGDELSQMDAAFDSLCRCARAYQYALSLVRLTRDMGFTTRPISDLEADLAEQRVRFLRAHAEYRCALERAQTLIERQPAETQGGAIAELPS